MERLIKVPPAVERELVVVDHQAENMRKVEASRRRDRTERFPGVDIDRIHYIRGAVRRKDRP